MEEVYVLYKTKARLLTERVLKSGAYMIWAGPGCK